MPAFKKVFQESPSWYCQNLISNVWNSVKNELLIHLTITEMGPTKNILKTLYSEMPFMILLMTLFSNMEEVFLLQSSAKTDFYSVLCSFEVFDTIFLFNRLMCKA